MVAHLLVRTLDAEMPATLSKAVLGDLLRVRLGYDGVAISDNCEMGALAERWSPAQIPVLAAQAGCDLVLFCADPHAQVEGLEGMLRAVESGAIDQTEMDKACARIRTLKQRFVVPYPDPSAATARAAVRPEHAALAQEIRERSRGGV
jgi:beta-glucosidase-like glycosyl hydrolase